MKPFRISRQNGTLEVVAKIADSMVQDYGCRVKYDPQSGLIDLVGEDFCKAIVTEIMTDMLKD